MFISCPRCSLRLLGSFALLLLAFVGFGPAAQAQAPVLTAIDSHGSLHVTIPYHSLRSGAGHLMVEILNPQGQALGRVDRRAWASNGGGNWKVTIAPAHPMAMNNLFWQRIHYRFAYRGHRAPAISDTQSISQILQRPLVRILGQTQYIAGSRAAIRVIVSHAHTGAPLSGKLHIVLLAPHHPELTLFAANLDRRGTVQAVFRFPAVLTGNYHMRYLVTTPIGSTEYTQPVTLKDEASVLLTTEKPIYQPGQTIHIRALALNRASHHPEAGQTITFEIQDSRGNRVFRNSTRTDSFGIAFATFTLADEVNLGSYHLRAIMGNPQAPTNTARLTFHVRRYVLPKFKVAIAFAKQNNKPRLDYRPGDYVTGLVRASYFFGKPVSAANVTVTITGMDVAAFQAASASGKTDAAGSYHFRLKLPRYFAGRPIDQGATRALVQASVTDSASHTETRGEPITVSASPLLITAIPEGGKLIPNLENDLFLLTSYPDGSPAPTMLTVQVPSRNGARNHMESRRISTNSSGVAVLRFRPMPGTKSLRINADDGHGNLVSMTVPLQLRAGADQILLHTPRAVVNVGDAIPLKVLSTRPHGTVYLDIVKDGQTILTRDVGLKNGQATITVDTTPEMAGMLNLDAYIFGRNSQPVSDHRLVFVEPANQLNISASTNAPVYLPGADARIHFHVTNSHGQGVEAALGLQIVDESVFALAQKQPGFAKVFFYLEKQLMQPRYEIHSLSMTHVVDADQSPDRGAGNLDARALFAATQMASPHKLDVVLDRRSAMQTYWQFQSQYREAFLAQMTHIASELTSRIPPHASRRAVLDAFATLHNGAPPRDAWNNPLRIQVSGWRWGPNTAFRVVSAGPDRQFGTGDDLAAYLEERSGVMAQGRRPNGSLNLWIEHGRGPFDQRASVTGSITDPTGAVIPYALVVLHSFPGNTVWKTHTNAAGKFRFSALPKGTYRIEAFEPGFQSVVSRFSLAPRDLAFVSIRLPVGAVTQAVIVALPGIAGAEGAGTGSMGDAQVVPEWQSPATARLKSNELIASAPSPVAQPRTHVRSYFPEALYINPEILTDAHGNAGVTIPMADSITTWRMAMIASTASGALGSGNSRIKVFQNFFVDFDLPVALTQGDRISIPVAVYNYSGKSGRVRVSLRPADWYTLQNDTAAKTIVVHSGRVASVHFNLVAKRIGKFKLAASAVLQGAGAHASRDVTARQVRVLPNGRRQQQVFNGRLENTTQREIHFSSAAIPGATSILVRLYPGPLSQVVEGMDSILHLPFGCFEQTSSTTYPNVLALNYMKRTGKLSPEIRARAEGYISTGYQRLLTFEVPGGGFSWFGRAPANKILTAYGLMEFYDMSKVSDVDPRLIARTRNWLIAQQQPDGSWNPDTQFINEGATNHFNSNVLRITAYIAWSLADTGYHGPAVDKAMQYIQSRDWSRSDAYTLAVIANFAVSYARDRAFTQHAMQALVHARREHANQVSWTTRETSVYSTGQSAVVETTGLATQALIQWGQADNVVRKALRYIESKRDANGNWGTTQATIMALRALLMSTRLSGANARGTVHVLLNGKSAATLRVTAENSDLFHQFVFKNIDARVPATVQLNFNGSGGLAWQIVGRSFISWTQNHAIRPLSIHIAYNRTHLAEDDIATAMVTIRNNTPAFANMVMVDLGIPPGFDLLTQDLQSFEDHSRAENSGRLEKFSLTATQAILYFNALAPNQTVTLHYRLRANFPIRALTFESRVYEYYDPRVNATAPPVELEVSARK